MSSGGCRASTGRPDRRRAPGGRGDGAVHELPQPAGARRYGQNFRAHRLMVRIRDPQVHRARCNARTS